MPKKLIVKKTSVVCDFVWLKKEEQIAAFNLHDREEKIALFKEMIYELRRTTTEYYAWQIIDSLKIIIDHL